MNLTDNNFERQFKQNLQNTIPPTDNSFSTTPTSYQKNTKKPLNLPKTVFAMAIIAITIIALLEAIALVILSTNYSNLVSFYDEDSEQEYALESEDNFYIYNSDGSIKTMSITCDDESYGYYNFNHNGSYELFVYSPEESEKLASSGSYTISSGNIINLTPSGQKTITFDFQNKSFSDGAHTFICKDGEGDE